MDKEKNSILVNFTNHPSGFWEKAQREEALKYGEIVDVPFPHVNEFADTQEISRLSQKYIEKIVEMKPAAVVCQGEFCLSYQVIKQLKERNIKVMAACSKREAFETKIEDGSIVKTAVFRFVQFREYT